MSAVGNICQTINILTAHMWKMARLHHFRQVHTCMNLASRLYLDGNEPVKNAVENIFVYSFSALQLSCTKAEWNLLKSDIPSPLYSAYLRQVMHGGC